MGNGPLSVLLMPPPQGRRQHSSNSLNSGTGVDAASKSRFGARRGERTMPIVRSRRPGTPDMPSLTPAATGSTGKALR